MQLSPRQYQVDPTGSSYVADTRPLMAAMGAQAASQIEGNRMMQETVQRGMKGVEDFAARRQLAAARAQLGTLSIDDPEYGQKLSGLVMDNPLAFTNEKTAPIANFAFKQAANDFQSKRESEQRTALQAAEFNLRRDLANMDTQTRMSLASAASNADIQAKIYSERFAALDQQRASVLRQMEATNSPVARAILNKQLQGINAKSEELSRGFEAKTASSDFDSFSSYSGYEPAPLPEDFTQASTTAGSAGNVPELPTAGEGTMSALDIIPPGIQDGGSFGAPSRIQEVPAAPFTAEDGLPPVPVEGGISVPPVPAPVVPVSAAAPVPVSTPVPAASPVPAATTAAPAPTGTPAYGLTLEDQRLLDTIIAEENLAKAKKTDEGMSASEYKADEDLLKNIVGSNREVSKLRAEVESLKSQESTAREAMGKDPVGFSAEKIAALNTLSGQRIDKEKVLKEAENSIELQARMEGPKKYITRELEDARKQAEETAKAQATLNAATATGATAAAAVDKIPSPPDPTIGMSAVEKNLYNIETMRQEGPKQRMAEREARRIESNQQWNKAKEQVYNLIGGTQGLAELLNAQEQPLIQGLEYNANIPANKPRLANELAQKIREKIATGTGNKKLEGFEQKLERLGPQKVSQEEIIAAVVEDILRAQESAAGKVRTMSNVPTTPTSTTADGKTGTLSPPQ